MILAGATSASVYYERWGGWFNSGYLRYSGYTFNYVSGEGILEDNTFGDKDYFCINTVPVLTFTCTGVGTAKLWVTSCSGYKDTGQSGQKEVDEGATWTAQGYLHIPSTPPQTVPFTAWGRWDTEDYLYYFNYVPQTPTYSADWHLDSSSTPGFTEGEGGCEGELVDFEE